VGVNGSERKGEAFLEKRAVQTPKIPGGKFPTNSLGRIATYSCPIIGERKDNQMFNKGINKIKTAWANDPMLTIVIASLAITAVAKVMDSASAAQGRRAYAKSVDYRINHK
jgi:hypothetical protein